MLKKDDEFLFVEKYRPQKMKDVILPEKYKRVFQDIITAGDLSHLLLAGGAGIGKTTLAKVICAELGVDVLVINASENGNIDTLRTTIREYASSVGFMRKKKVVILDEADYLNAQSTQPALRGFMEEFSKNCRFILTANHINRIIEPLRSRCSVIEFSYSKDEKLHVGAEFMKRVVQILREENVEFDTKVVAELIKTHLPDMRKILNEIQSNIIDGKLNDKLLATFAKSDVDHLILWMKKKEFTKLRTWCAENTDMHFSELGRLLYDNLDKVLQPTSIPEAVLLINQYDERNGFVSDKEINMVAFFTECMMELEFK